MKDLKYYLDKEVLNRNNVKELSEESPDPLMIAKDLGDEFSILTCALFSYGNAKQIVKFLKKIPFNLIDRAVGEKSIRKELEGLKYRFQNNEDIVQWILMIQRIKIQEKEKQKINNGYFGKNPKESLLKSTFIESYRKNLNVTEGLYSVIDLCNKNLNGYESDGIKFLIGRKDTNSPLKRLNMFLRWMVRKDNLDLGWWNEVNTSDLIIPLDTHTFKLGKKLGLINRKSYDMKSAIELTESLKVFDKNDPVKYDFALYRIGQEKIDIL
jgi:uncharacterized protein (TIGR02757 family)